MTHNVTNQLEICLSEQTHVLVMVSGGIDSMVLLDFMQAYRRRYGFRLGVVHFNYHLRGAESDRDATFVKHQARLKGCEFYSFSTPLTSKSRIQEQARQIRYDHVKQLCAEQNFQLVAVGHHADDHVETILMNVMRGAGAKGRSGIGSQRPLADGVTLIRPLLNLTRVQIEKYARYHHVPFVEDASNAQLVYLRNSFRHQWIPALQRRLPNLKTSLVKSSAFYLKQFQKYQSLAHAWLAQSENVSSYVQLPAEVRFLIIEHGLKKAAFDKQVSRRLFEEIDALIQSPHPHRKKIGLCWFNCDHKSFTFTQTPNTKLPSDWQLTIPGPGRYWIEPLQKQLVIEPASRHQNHPPKDLHVNAQSLQFPLQLKFPQPGQRFRPFGLKGTKKLKKFFNERKVPAFQRCQTPLLWQKDQLVCVVGQEIDDRFRLPNQAPNENQSLVIGLH